MNHSRYKRRGMTLIELLTVIMILAVLFALGVLFFPDIEQQSRTANGAIAFQGWLEIAKQRAQRDQNPHGLRLFVDAKSHVTECQYIEQPDPFAEGQLTTLPRPGDMDDPHKVLVNAILSGGPGIQRVQVNDHLELLDSGLIHRIVAVQETIPDQQFELTLGSAISFTITGPANPSFPNDPTRGGTTHYRIIRQPRLVGEESLKLPSEIVVDLATNSTFGNPLAFSGAAVDVLFAPSGEVIGTQTLSDQLYFWIRDRELGLTEGEPTIIAVRTRSGQVASYPVDLTDTSPADNVPDDPYYQVRFAP